MSGHMKTEEAVGLGAGWLGSVVTLWKRLKEGQPYLVLMAGPESSWSHYSWPRGRLVPHSASFPLLLSPRRALPVLGWVIPSHLT